MESMQDKYRSHFPDWVPHNIMTNLCDVPTKGYENVQKTGMKTSATFIGNNTAIQVQEFCNFI